MILKNARIYNSQEKIFKNADITVENGKFESVNYLADAGESASVIIPGFLDIHTHGAVGVDMMNADSGQLAGMSKFYAENGVTSLFLTTWSEKQDKILSMIEQVKKARRDRYDGAYGGKS
jgi:N-acetylglucosamine-6-phosphate deacetylase